MIVMRKSCNSAAPSSNMRFRLPEVLRKVSRGHTLMKRNRKKPMKQNIDNLRKDGGQRHTRHQFSDGLRRHPLLACHFLCRAHIKDSYQFGASDATIDYAVDYLTIYLVGTLFVELALGLNAFIICQSRPGIPGIS